jgi:hypothetical protein
MKNIFICLVLYAGSYIFSACSTSESSVGNKGISFDSLDLNSDEKISLAEFQIVPTNRGTPEELFNNTDTNSDGYISRDEYENIGNGKRDGKRDNRERKGRRK